MDKTKTFFLTFCKEFYLFLAALVLWCCMWAVSSLANGGYYAPVAAHGLLTAGAPLAAEHGLWGERAPAAAATRL